MYRILKEAWRLGKLGERHQSDSLQGQNPFLQSAAIRHVDAGSCNGCELEIQALGGPHYALEQAGLHFVASPRHADVLLVTGPVTRHMAAALKDTYAAMPQPRVVVALGDCACGMGPFTSSYATLGAVDRLLPVHLACPGCPPPPTAILAALERAMMELGVTSRSTAKSDLQTKHDTHR